jgi:hypothetical protein
LSGFGHPSVTARLPEKKPISKKYIRDTQEKIIADIEKKKFLLKFLIVTFAWHRRVYF